MQLLHTDKASELRAYQWEKAIQDNYSPLLLISTTHHHWPGVTPVLL